MKIAEIHDRKVLGQVIAHVLAVEFQKRGLPHVHDLLYLHEKDKIRDAVDVDRLISAEIPFTNVNPKLNSLVKTHMIHGPCGNDNPNSPCMDQDNKKCTKNYPKTFSEETVLVRGKYPAYRRRDNKQTIDFKSSKLLADNRYVVPYNPYLLLTLETHINVEICASFEVVKYLFKYMYKGVDSATIKVTIPDDNKNDVPNDSAPRQKKRKIIDYDEISFYLSGRVFTPPESFYRLLELPLHKLSHTIRRLAVHLENYQIVCFKRGYENRIKERNNGTTLTAWFKLNVEDPEARQYLYTEIPQHYIFDEAKKIWFNRQIVRKPILPRLYFVSPKEQERFALRLLLMNVRGATSFQNLRTINNIEYHTFKEAAIELGLIKTDAELDACLREASTFQMPNNLAQLFGYILVFHVPIDALELYNKYKPHFFQSHLPLQDAEQLSLRLINNILQSHNMTLQQFNLPSIETSHVDTYTEPTTDPMSHIESLTSTQKIIFNSVLDALNGATEDKLFYIDGPGGTGKSYLLNTIIEYCLKSNISILPIAWTGIAANLLINGRTATSACKFPLDLNDTTTCNITVNSTYGQEFKNNKIIIWDEISTVNKFAFEALDKFLRDLHRSNKPFGNIIIIVSGDFRQILPVLKHGTRSQVLEICVNRSKLWNLFKKFSLTSNLRVHDDQIDFKNWLLDIGENKNCTDIERKNNLKMIPKKYLSNGNLIKEIYGETIDPINDDTQNKVILAPRNIDVLRLNDEILDKIDGPEHVYLSIDSVDLNKSKSKEAHTLPPEYLNTITPNGFPQFKFKVKIGSIVLLLINFNLKEGLCNGTRLLVLECGKFVLRTRILNGKNAGNIVLIPRIDNKPKDDDLPFALIRRQFPLRLGFAMTINKSQGQSFNKVGIYMPIRVFSHGQLYVACSRSKDDAHVKIHLENNALTILPHKDHTGKIIDHFVYTTNVVYSEIFDEH